MITSRYILQDDYETISKSLLGDSYHKDTPPEFFYEEGTVCSVFSDEQGPILFVRGKPIYNGMIAAIQLDIQFLDNNDAKRNMRAMLHGFPIINDRAKDIGFAGFIFQSDVEFLRKFCVKRLGFQEIK